MHGVLEGPTGCSNIFVCFSSIELNVSGCRVLDRSDQHDGVCLPEAGLAMWVDVLDTTHCGAPHSFGMLTEEESTNMGVRNLESVPVNGYSKQPGMTGAN